MPINEDEVVFPQNIINVLAEAAKDIDPDQGIPSDPNYIEGIRVFKQPMDIKFGTESIAIYPDFWTPDMNSKEMGFIRSPVEPTIQHYNIIIQSLIIHADEATGIAQHSVLASRLRHMLYRDEALRVVLPTLSISHGVGGPVERLQRWDITRQKFLNSELNGQFAFLSELELGFDTTLD